jgi:hypothetical protein
MLDSGHAYDIRLVPWVPTSGVGDSHEAQQGLFSPLVGLQDRSVGDPGMDSMESGLTKSCGLAGN